MIKGEPRDVVNGGRFRDDGIDESVGYDCDSGGSRGGDLNGRPLFVCRRCDNARDAIVDRRGNGHSDRRQQLGDGGVRPTERSAQTNRR